MSEHFSLAELSVTNHRQFDNTPPPEVLGNLRVLAEGLELVREALGGLPIHINSAYRSPEVNAAVGSKPTSQHMQGMAADITCVQFGTPLQVCQAIIKARVPFDQLILEFGSWAHISFAPSPRGQVLTIDKRGTRVGLSP